MTPITAAAYTNSFAAPPSTTLFVIDAAGGTLSRQGGPDGMPSPNAGELTSIGWLNLPAAPCSFGFGFDIAGGHNGLALTAIRADGVSTILCVVCAQSNHLHRKAPNGLLFVSRVMIDRH